MYLTYDETYWIIDTEGDGLPSNKVWVLCYENAVTDERGYFTSYDDIRRFFDERKGHTFVGHNILKYDAPTLNRVVGTSLPVSRLVDTLVLCTLYNPALAGGHSLEAWARRLNLDEQKVGHEDWSRYSEAMLKRCQSDVRINKQLFKRITSVLSKIEFSEKSCEIQHKITCILDRQQKNGFFFNYEEAHKLFIHIRQREDELRKEIYHQFPPELKCVKSYRRHSKADGSSTKAYAEHLQQFPKLVNRPDGGYDAFEYVSFNLGSPLQRVEKLLELGWQPEEFTPRTKKGGGGNPKVTEKGELVPSLLKFLEEKDVPEVRLIAKWIALNGRANMLSTWMDNYNYKTGCIHGNIWVAQTLRFRHTDPNTANIPAVRTKDDKVVYGEDGFFTFEARNCWTTRDRVNRTLIGSDAKSLEYRMLAHHVNNPDLISVVLNSDVHSFTQKMAGLEHRHQGKTLNFAIIYGSGDAKTGKIAGGSVKVGKALKAKLYENIPGLGDAIEEAKAEFRKGRIILVDGSRIVCPAEHASFNYKLQGGGARVMAQAAIFLEGHIRRQGLDSLKVGDIHDEWQYDVLNEDAEEHMRLVDLAFKEAGEEFNMNLPMAGESKRGLTWAATH